MHQELEAAEAALGLTLANLRQSAERTDTVVTQARAEVQRYLETELGRYTHTLGLDILAFGSMARAEMVEGSDFDFLVVANKSIEDPSLVQAFRSAAQSALDVTLTPRPGASGLFGVLVGAPDLVNQIGLDQDTNKSLSRRILILQESLCLNQHNSYDRLVEAILRRYLHDYGSDQKPRVPRFLFNDVLRFWRTIAVDYQAKRWEEMEGTKWGLRYIKLRASRKWTFAASVIALYMPVIANQPTNDVFLQKQFAMPALARIAQLHAYLPDGGSGRQALADVLTIADQFLGWQKDKAWRDEVSVVTAPLEENSELFREAREATSHLQDALQRLFLCREPVGVSGISMYDLSAKYMTF